MHWPMDSQFGMRRVEVYILLQNVDRDHQESLIPTKVNKGRIKGILVLLLLSYLHVLGDVMLGG